MKNNQSNITAQVVSLTIIIGIPLLILNISIEEFRIFFFVSMFTLDTITWFYPASQAPSLFEVLVALGTLVGVIYTAKYLIGQSKHLKTQTEVMEAQEKRAIEIFKLKNDNKRLENENLEKTEHSRTKIRLHDALDKIIISNNSSIWFNNIRIIQDIAIDNPFEFAESSIISLINIGKDFSSQLAKIKDGGSLPMFDKVEACRLVAELVGMISTINKVRPYASSNKRGMITLSDFMVNIPTNAQTNYQIHRGFFEDISFNNCDFATLEFFECNFYGSEFYKLKNVKLNMCLISGGSILRQTNQFSDEEQFKIPDIQNFIWDNDLGSLTGEVDNMTDRLKIKFNVKHFIGNIMRMNSKEFFDDWSKLPPPRITKFEQW